MGGSILSYTQDSGGVTVFDGFLLVNVSLTREETISGMLDGGEIFLVRLT